MLYARYTHPNAGYDHEQKRAQEFLNLGTRYQVDKICMDTGNTDVYLTNVLNINCGAFNSVFFDFEDEDGTPHDIYTDPQYNPYL